MTAILLIDDDKQRRHDTRACFQTHPEWKLLEAESAQAGRIAFQEHTIDLVILELSSAGRAEEELFEWIRTDQARIPVILLTDDNIDEKSRVEALVMGAASYVPLSLVARDLVVTVERIVNLSASRRRHARMAEGLLASETTYQIEDNDLTIVQVLIGHLIDTAEEFGVVTTKNRMQIAVALEEALTNGIVHGNLQVPSALKDDGDSAFYRMVDQRRNLSPYADRRLFVRGQFEQGFSRFTITDEGDGFDPASVDDPTHPSNHDKPHGRGLFLMRAFMDQISFNESGNEIQLIKRGPLPKVPLVDNLPG